MSVDPYNLFFIFIFGLRTPVSFKRICLFFLGKSTRLNGYVYFYFPLAGLGDGWIITERKTSDK